MNMCLKDKELILLCPNSPNWNFVNRDNWLSLNFSPWNEINLYKPILRQFIKVFDKKNMENIFITNKFDFKIYEIKMIF